MRSRAQVSEQQVAAVVVAWLEALGADVYQEVECGSGVADIVAKIRAEIWVVEVKTSLSLALLVQAMDRRQDAHRVVVAAPYTRNMRDVARICESIGVGLLDVRVAERGWSHYGGDFGDPAVIELVHAPRVSHGKARLAEWLKPEHKTHAKAGAVGGGGRWTPFRETCEELRRVVLLEPGISVKAAVEKMRHHYGSNKSAISSLAHWVERGKVAGVRVETVNGRLALQPVESR